MKIKPILISALLILVLILSACGSQQNNSSNNELPEMNIEDNNSSGEANHNDDTNDNHTDDPEDQSLLPSVEVKDQEIAGGSVTIPSVTMAEDGWVVIHTANAEGKPGPVIGYAQVSAGTSNNVAVNIEADKATPQLFAMLHIDAGTAGAYEFPGDDAPVKNGDAVVVKPFSLSGLSASVAASDQEITNGTVTIGSAYMLQPGFVVIHTANEEGKPGPVIGYAPLPAGPSEGVTVSIEAEKATPKLFAMLHIDAGNAGVYEFPGDDVPVTEGDAVVLTPFNIEGAATMEGDSSSTLVIDIANFTFSPNDLEIKVGTTVTWTNLDDAPHTATADDQSFDSGSLGKNESFSYTFNEAGTFTYYCAFHPSMTAAITVVP